MENEGLVEKAARVGPYLLRRLQETVGDHPYVGEVRGVGLILAVEFMADKERRRPFDPAANVHRIVAAEALEHGIMVRPLPFIEVIPFSPPLCLTEADCDEAADGFARALEATTPLLHRLAVETPHPG
jgi:L-2,4-diaminobutyrate transaminase